MNSVIILVDMDNTIADFNGRIVSTYNSRHPEGSHITHEDSDNWEIDLYYGEVMSPEVGKELRDIYYEKGFFENLDPISGSIDALSEMLSEGYQVYLCTSPLSKFENCVSEKYKWVQNHMGNEWSKRIILTKDKTMIRGSILIDDKPIIRGTMEPIWKHIYYSQPYNISIDKPRIINWKDWKSVIEGVLNNN